MSATDLTEIAAIPSFWFEQPAHVPIHLISKFGRWYQGGVDLDRDIDARFLGSFEWGLVAISGPGKRTSRASSRASFCWISLLAACFATHRASTAGDEKACQLALELIAATGI